LKLPTLGPLIVIGGYPSGREVNLMFCFFHPCYH